MPARDDSDVNATRSERAPDIVADAQKPPPPVEEPEAMEPTVVAREICPGDKVGEYDVREVIGSGTFGVVVRAEHVQLGREVAIKILKRAFVTDPNVLGRFLAEARAVNRIRHPNIVDVYGFGALEDGRQFYVMDLLKGRALSELLSGGTKLPFAQVVTLLRPLADALGAAHAAGITHRDIKPENVFIEARDGAQVPRLLDFGIARVPQALAPGLPATRVGVVMGTPCYMAPEQALGETVDARSDVFSFGVMAYRMLTGVLPWDGDSLTDVVRKQLHGAAPRPVSSFSPVPAHVDAALSWLLAPDRTARCPDIQSALATLEGTLRPKVVERALAATRDERRVELSPAPALPHVGGLPSFDRIAAEEVREERSGTGRLVLSLIVSAALAAGGLFALDRAASGGAPVEFVFEGKPVAAEIVSASGEVLGRLPSTVRFERRQLPTTVEVRAPGHLPQKRPLSPDSLKVQLVTLTPQQ